MNHKMCLNSSSYYNQLAVCTLQFTIRDNYLLKLLLTIWLNKDAIILYIDVDILC